MHRLFNINITVVAYLCSIIEPAIPAMVKESKSILWEHKMVYQPPNNALQLFPERIKAGKGIPSGMPFLLLQPSGYFFTNRKEPDAAVPWYRIK